MPLMLIISCAIVLTEQLIELKVLTRFLNGLKTCRTLMRIGVHDASPVLPLATSTVFPFCFQVSMLLLLRLSLQFSVV